MLYYCADANQSVTALVDTAGAVVERYLYDPYGKATFLQADWSLQEVEGHADGTASAFANELLFTGHRLDPESGLYITLHRHYHPTLGRWMQRDPKGYVDGMGLYEYCRSGPVIGLDPMGLKDLYLDSTHGNVLGHMDWDDVINSEAAKKIFDSTQTHYRATWSGGLISSGMGDRLEKMKPDDVWVYHGHASPTGLSSYGQIANSHVKIEDVVAKMTDGGKKPGPALVLIAGCKSEGMAKAILATGSKVVITLKGEWPGGMASELGRKAITYMTEGVEGKDGKKVPVSISTAVELAKKDMSNAIRDYNLLNKNPTGTLLDVKVSSKPREAQKTLPKLLEDAKSEYERKNAK